MPLNEDVELVVETLIKLGVVSEEGCKRFAAFIRSLQALSGGLKPEEALATPGLQREAQVSARQRPISPPTPPLSPVLEPSTPSSGFFVKEDIRSPSEEFAAVGQAPAVKAKSNGTPPTPAITEEPVYQEIKPPGAEARPSPSQPRLRARRGSFNPSEEELRQLYQQMTAKQIGEQFGVSPATVNVRLRQFGIQKEGGRGAKRQPMAAPAETSAGEQEPAKASDKQSFEQLWPEEEFNQDPEGRPSQSPRLRRGESITKLVPTSEAEPESEQAPPRERPTPSIWQEAEQEAEKEENKEELTKAGKRGLVNPPKD